MRITSVINLKGGVGKTVTVINLAAILAHDHKKRVLVVDADSQANLTEFFEADPALETLADIMLAPPDSHEREEMFLRAIQPTDFEGVDIVAGSDALMDLDLTRLAQADVSQDAICALTRAVQDRYDYVLIDCPPAFNAAAAAALLASTDVVIPIKLDAFSLRGMSNLVRQITNMRRLNPGLQISGCLPTMFYSSDNLRESLALLHKGPFPVFSMAIRRSPKVDEMTFEGKPLCVFSTRCSAGVDYRAFAEAYVRQEDA